MPKSSTPKTIRTAAPYAHVEERLNRTAFNRSLHKHLDGTTVEAAAVKLIQTHADKIITLANTNVARRMVDAKRKLITEVPYESELTCIANWNKEFSNIPGYYFKNKKQIFNSMPARKELTNEEKAAVKQRRLEHAARTPEERETYKAAQKIVRAAKAAATRAAKKVAVVVV